MLRLTKRRAVIFSGLLSFIVGCTLTLSLLNLHSCTEKISPRSEQNNDPIHEKAKRNDSILIILILTSPANVNRRDVIRETWLSLCKNNSVVQYHFVIGGGGISEEMHSFIVEEQSVHHDLIVLPHVYDNYKSLTQKVLEAFVWIDKAVKHFHYLLKCDDDSFVQVDKVVLELITLKVTKGHSLYWGFFNGRGHVKESGKWKESDWVLCDYYLPYALGGGYVLSQKLIHFIAANAKFLR
jgi:galactosylxylosylprotein 3-beta-galactosyltransferase